MKIRIDNDKLKTATGKDALEWYNLLEQSNAREKTHREITRMLEEYIKDPRFGQEITIAYEREIGRRVVGQDCYGQFRASGSKTLSGVDIDQALALFSSAAAQLTEIDGASIEGEPRISKSDGWRYWKADVADGTKVNVHISLKGEGKVTIGLEHVGVADEEARDRAKAFWKSFFAGLKVPEAP